MARPVLLTCMLLLGSMGVSAQNLSGKDRQDFTESLARQCFVTQRSSQLNSQITDSAIRVYCQCSANKLADAVTVQDLQRMTQIVAKQGAEAAQRDFATRFDTTGIGMQCLGSFMQR